MLMQRFKSSSSMTLKTVDATFCTRSSLLVSGSCSKTWREEMKASFRGFEAMNCESRSHPTICLCFGRSIDALATKMYQHSSPRPGSSGRKTCEWFSLSATCFLLRTMQSHSSRCTGISLEDSFILRLTWDAIRLICPCGMGWFHFAGRVVPLACKNKIERQIRTSEDSCLNHYLCVPKAIRSWVSQIITTLAAEEQRRLLQLKHLIFSGTVLHLFHASSKTPTSEGKLYCRTKGTSEPSTLLDMFREIPKCFHALCVSHTTFALLISLRVVDITGWIA